MNGLTESIRFPRRKQVMKVIGKASYIIAWLTFVFFVLAGVIIPAFRQMFEDLGIKMTRMQLFVLKINPVIGVVVGMALGCITILKDKWCSPRASRKLNGGILFVVVVIAICIFLSLFLPEIEIKLSTEHALGHHQSIGKGNI